MNSENQSIAAFAELLTTLQKTPDSDVSDLIMGKVVSIEPMTIEITVNGPDGFIKIPLSGDYLFIGALCKEYWIPKHYIDEPPHKHEYHHGNTSPEISAIKRIMIWRGLRVGDNVVMIKLRRGQLYYVVQRWEGCEAN